MPVSFFMQWKQLNLVELPQFWTLDTPEWSQSTVKAKEIANCVLVNPNFITSVSDKELARVDPFSYTNQTSIEYFTKIQQARTSAEWKQ